MLTITPGDEVHTIDASGGTYSIGFTANGAWSVTEALTWATVTPSSGDSSVTSLQVTVLPSALKTARIGIIKIGNQTHTLTQTGVAAIPVIGPLTGTYQAIVGGDFTLTIPTTNAPVTYTATNLPPGLTLSNSTGILSGIPTKPGTYVMTVKAKNVVGSAADTLTFTVEVQPLATGTVGTFNGLIDRDSVLNRNLGSRLVLTTTASGSYTGKLNTGTTAISFKGVLTATTSDPAKATLSVALPTLGATLSLTLDDATDSLTGTLSDGGGNTTTVNAWRNSWADVTDNAADFAGLHTFYLAQPDTAVYLPQGYGYGSFVVSAKTGALTFSGKLADGSALTGSTFVGQSGQVLLYLPLYSSRGSLAGKLTITPGASAPVDNTLAGTPTWLKPDPQANSKDTVYRAGFGPLTLTAAGGAYTAPTAGTLVLALSVGTDNAKLRFTGGALTNPGFNQLLTIYNPSVTGLTNKTTVAINSNSVKLPMLTAVTGQFTGEFTITGATAALNRKAPFSGQVVTTSADGTKGYGFFLLPKEPATGETVTTSPKLSGSVLLGPP